MTSSTNGRAQFLEEVFPAELAEIRQRREVVGASAAELSGAPSTRLGLVGLALSGGGIRSATFSLGALQALARHGVLRAVDYLSTVSGGGFIGSCLSSLLNSRATGSEGETFPLRCVTGEEEPASVRHLRNSGNYLAPGGLLDKVRLAVVLLRGLLNNALVFLPFLMLAVVATEVVYELGRKVAHLQRIIPVAAPALFVVLALTFPFVARLMRGRFTWRQRDRYELLLSFGLLAALLSLCLALFFVVVGAAIGLSPEEFKLLLEEEVRHPFEREDLWKWLAVLAVVGLFSVAARASQSISRLGSRLVLYTVGLLGPALLVGVYLVLCVYQIDSPFVDAKLPLTRGAEFEAGLAVQLDAGTLPGRLRERFQLPAEVALTVQEPGKAWLVSDPQARRYYTIYREQHHFQIYNEFRPELDQGILSEGLREEFRRKGGIAQAARILVTKPGLEWLILESLPDGEQRLRIWRAKDRLETDRSDLWDGRDDWIFVGLTLGLLALNRLFVNVNITSAHGFYRDRLSKAYLLALDGEGLRHNDAQKLSRLNVPGAKAPYHLLNVALNVNDRRDANVRGRNSDFFIFSKHFTGGERTGSCPTAPMEAVDGQLDLGTAMAISGATAAPNAGTTTVRPLVFILTLLNIRLGYWLPSPARVAAARWHERLLLRFGAGPWFLLREALGSVHAGSAFVNLSDGRHLENLGLYELLRRRCRCIVAVDGECDPELRFGSLLKLILYARIDLGVEIEIDLTDLRRIEAGLSRSHWLVGRIKYGEDETGHLLYLKSSMTGDENEWIREYRRAHPDFPHQPTSDQFFDEPQFEAYRSLGYHIADGLLRDEAALREVGDLLARASRAPA
ncbi:MAG: patatin-like phospholipase family protein [Verrucomicrobia bacterium]|nr:patatin-like phospholipase family protein [Verrucomicrobiota bacterium]